MTAKAIPGFNGRYVISRSGVVTNKMRGRQLVTHVDRRGYCYVVLSDAGNSKSYRVHRLMLMSFRPNKNADNLDVNHLNGIKSDNRLANLEWASRGENHKHRYRVLNQRHSMLGKFGKKHHRAIGVIGSNAQGETACQFDSLMDAQRAGFQASKISNCLAGTRKTHAGLYWKASALENF